MLSLVTTGCCALQFKRYPFDMYTATQLSLTLLWELKSQTLEY